MSDDRSNLDRRRFLKGSAVAAVSMGLAGCGGQNGGGESPTETETTEETTTQGTPTDAPDDAQIQEGGVFNFGMGTAPKGINPLATSSSYSWNILDLVYEYGTYTDPVNFEVHPSVYTDWTSEELDETGENDQPNVKVYFDVRDGLTFNDGEELTLDDVVFTYRYMMEQKPGRYVSTVNPILEVKKSDGDWDVEMTLNKPIGTYASSQLQIPILPKHQWEGVEDFKSFEPQNNGGPVGLGPGVVTRYQPDTAVEVSFAEREGEYTLGDLDYRSDIQGIISGGPFLDAVRFKIYGSESALNQAFLQGEIDSLFDTIRTSRIEDVQDAEGKSLVDGFDTGYAHYSLNLRTQPLDDISFRQVLGFAFDDVYWTERLQRGYVQEGDFVMPPGYKAVRPETGSDQELLSGNSTQAFHFRQSSAGVPDVEGIRAFLTEGKAITGESGTYVGQEYPGSLSGVTASQTESKYEYSFGEPQTSLLKQNENADKELRVDGQTITELNGGEPLTMYVYPAKETPQTAKMVETYINSLQRIGIPIERTVMSFNTMLTKVYGEEDFDIFPMSWSSLSPFATSTLYSLFHSDNADDHSTTDAGDSKNTSTLLNNPMGYGLFDDASADDLIMEARTTMDTEQRNQLARQAVEKIYLDFPTMITSYSVKKWPVNSADWSGFIGNIPGPGSAYLADQFMQIHQTSE